MWESGIHSYHYQSWGHLLPIFNECFNFWRILGFSTNFPIFGEFFNFNEFVGFWRVFQFLMNVSIFNEFFNFWRICRFLTNFQFLKGWCILRPFGRKFFCKNDPIGGNLMREIDCAHSRSVKMPSWPSFREKLTFFFVASFLARLEVL